MREYDPALDGALARRSLLDFARLVYPRFDDPPHIRHIAELLERVECGELRRLMISLPVRHGKSVTGSQVFPAWFLGRNPELNVILVSHSQDLAERNSRVAKHLVEDDRWPFSQVRLSSDSTAASRWNVRQGGGLYAVGVGGAITGRGADVLIIDDALHDGQSETERESVFRWYGEVAFPRLEPGGAIIVIGARFASDDLCGRILDSDDGENWEVVNLPALAEEGDPLGRSVGEPLWPARMGVDELEMRRIGMGTRAFEAQFQQQPMPAGGLLFKREWFEDNRYAGGMPPAQTWIKNIGYELGPGLYSESIEGSFPVHKVLAIDCASKTGIANDYSVLATLAHDEVDMYVVDVVRERLEFTDLVRKVVETVEKWDHDYIYIEDASAGTQVIQELRRWTGYNVNAVKPTVGKYVRAESATPFFESGRVRLPRSAHWLDDFLDEFLRFPGGTRHDDIVDAVVMGVIALNEIVVHLQRSRESQSRAEGLLLSRGSGFASSLFSA